MTYASEIVTTLNASAPLLMALVGGVYDYTDTGKKGLTREITPQAFDDVTGLIRPTAIVLELSGEMDGQAVSPNTGYFSTVSPVLIRIYNNANLGYAVIIDAEAQIRVLLNNQRITGGFQTIWKSTLKNRRDPELKDAAWYQATYQVFGWVSSS
jgi:hypothetical protein